MSTETADAQGQSTRRRGVGSPGLATGRRSIAGGPQKPRTRSWGLMVLATLLVLGSGLAVAAWGLHAGQKMSVLVLTAPVAKGQTIEREDLASRPVAGVDDAIAVESSNDVVGQVAAVDLVQGQILTSALVTAEPVPGPREAMIGLALDPTRVPGAGLEAGDQVDVIAVPGGGGNTDGKADTELDAPVVLSAAAQVFEVGGESAAGGLVLVTLLVDENDAAKLAAYSTQNRVAVVETAPTGATDSAGE